MSGAKHNKPVPEHLRRSVETSKCEYRRRGRSGLKVSVPILGAMSFCQKEFMEWVLEEEEWDTANGYSNGESERIIAKAIKEYEIPRQKFIIATKCFAPVGEGQEWITPFRNETAVSKDYVNQHGLSRQAIVNAV